MALSVYDKLAHAIQEAFAEQETNEEVRVNKIRQALQQSGHTDLSQRMTQALAAHQEKGHR